MSESNLPSALLQSRVSVGGLPAIRKIVALELRHDGSWQVCGSGVSDASGQATLNLRAQPVSAIYAVAVDEWGRPWSPGMTVSAGDTVRPSSFSGWVYRVASAGVLPTDEPIWWTGDSIGPMPVGTAMLEAVRYYQPIAHGPLPLEFSAPADTYWYEVVCLAPFDETPGVRELVDKTGRVWTLSGGAEIRADLPLAGEASLYLDGYGSVETASAPEFDLGAGDFTIETWFHPLTSGMSLVSRRSSGPYGWVLASSGLRGRINGQWSDSHIYWAEPSLGTWHHIALVKSGQTLNVYLDGNSVGSKAGVVSFNNESQPVRLGVANASNENRFRGYMANFRFTRAARYMGSFTPDSVYPVGA